jgi:hypothetical protein
MKRFYLPKLILLIGLLSGCTLGVSAQTVVFNYTGAVQTWTVPAGVSSVSVDMIGPRGGTNGCGLYYGKGGRVQCKLSVTPGQVLNIYVGGKGTDYTSCCGFQNGGWNGGGYGYYEGSGGGGATDIRIGGTALANRVIVAGGGGGAGYYYCNDNGGNGGGTTGGNGTWGGSYNSCYNGSGGTQTGGGTCGCYSSANGSLGQGGNSYTGYYYQGGGGGGYYGGAGAYDYGGGGGGSSYTDAVLCSSVVHTQGYAAAISNGQVTIVGPTINAGPTTLPFGSVLAGSCAPAQTFTVNGNNLSSSPVTITAPTAFQVSTDNTTWASSVNLTFTPPTLSTTTIYVRFCPPAYASYSGNITISGSPTAPAIAVSGIGDFPCTGTPTAGTASSSVPAASATTPFTLSVAGASGGGGLTYQWQMSSYPTFGFSNIPGATTSSFNYTGLTGSTYFRAQVICPFSGLSATTNTIVVNLIPGAAGCIPTAYYVPPNYSSNLVCSNNMGVASAAHPFSITGASGTSISDNTACAALGYADQTSIYRVTLAAGGSYGATVGTTTSNYSMSTQIWIDFNNDGVFATTESVGGGSWSTAGSTVATITIPSTAVPGTVARMRVTAAYASGCSTTYPCYPNIPSCTTTGVNYAETRDYTVVISGPNCLGTPTVGTVTPDVPSACANFVSNLTLSGFPTVSGINYQWQSSPDNTTWTNVSGATNVYYTATVTASKYYRNLATCTNGFLQNATPGVQLVINAPPTISGVTNVCMPNTSTLIGTPAGGTWNSSNTSVANVGYGTGVVSGVTPGVAVITYNAPTGCIKTITVTVNSAPASVSGSSNVCSGSTTTVSDITTGGVWSSSNSSFATVGSSSGIVTGVAAGSANIIYTLPNGCTAINPMTINSLPAAIGGTTSVCLGSSTILTNATAGGTWSTSNSFAATIDPTTGGLVATSVAPVNAIYTLPTGCSRSTAITINALPSPISGAASVCAGSTTTLSNVGGGTWSSSNTSIASVNALTGDVTGVTTGVANIIYTLPGTGCTISSPMTINGVPTVFNVTVTNGGGYCPGGTGVHIGLTGSNSGINYNLYDGSSTLISTISGTSAALDYGLFTTPSTYTIVAEDASTGCTRSMSGSATVYVATPPNASYTVGGGGNYCGGGSGVPVTLSNSDLGVNYQLFNGVTPVTTIAGTGGPVSFGLQTLAGSYTVLATDALTLCTNTMSTSTTVGINTPPSAYTVSAPAGNSYCAGGTGVDIQLANSDAGVNYTLYRGTVAVATMGGVSGMLDFGNQATPGVYTVVGDDGTCTSAMTGSVNVIMNPLPVPYSITGGGNYCAGGAGVTIGLSNSNIGTDYQLWNGGPVGASVSGSSAGLNFGLITTPGTYGVMATIAATGCTVSMPGSVSVNVNALPNSYPVTALSGSSSYCAGDAGVQVGLPSSDAGVNYQLYFGLSAVGTPVLGTGGSVSLGNQTAQGTYTIKAINPATTCSTNMSGSVNVTINPLPTTYTVSGGGGYCAGGSGMPVVLNNSTLGVNYDVYLGGTTYVGTYPGSGSTLTLGSPTAPGLYTVVANDPLTGCHKNMAGSATITVNPLPAAYNVTGGGSYCAGGNGVHVGLSVSNAGVNYQLINGGVVSTLPGTGFALDFGLQTAAGTYTINAINTATTCSNTMTGAAPVIVSSNPTVYTVIAPSGSSYCAGGTGDTIALSASDAGINYQLFRGTTALGSAVTSAGGMLNFGAYTAGIYKVVATDPATGCNANMASSVVLTANPLPTAYTVTGGGDYCAGSAGVGVGLSGSGSSVNYQLISGGSPVATMTGTGGAISFGSETAGSYTITALDTVTGCTNNMTGTATATVHPIVVPAVTSTARTGDTVCTGLGITYGTSVTGGGSTPSFQWSVNGTTISTATGSTYSYTPANGDVVSVTVTSSDMCATPTTAVSRHTVTVSAPVTPSVSVSAAGPTTLCSGSSVTVNAASTNGGSTPGIEWRKNGVALVGSGPSYSFVPSNGDVVFAILNSSFPCRTADFVYSNDLTFNVDMPTPPAFNIVADPGTTIAKGQGVFFSANLTQVPGTTYTYKWMLGTTVIAGATGATYTPAAPLANGDVVSCVITSTNSCGPRTTTQAVTMNVNALGVTAVNAAGSDIKVMPNPNKGTFTVKGTLAGVVNDEASIEITNMLGQVVYHNNTTVKNGVVNEQVQLAGGLANGMYILNIRSGAGNVTFHFVIEQ